VPAVTHSLRGCEALLDICHTKLHHLMQSDAGNPMRTTVTLDDDLIRRAQEVTGIIDRSALLNEALTRLIQQEAARRLIMLGGSAPDLKAPPRRRLPGS
jgi:Arc/MetJ family transcription regulator